jgi:hypothetical protein
MDDYEQMSIEELEAAVIQLDQQRLALRDEQRRLHEVLDRKKREWRAGRSGGQIANVDIARGTGEGKG